MTLRQGALRWTVVALAGLASAASAVTLSVGPAGFISSPAGPSPAGDIEAGEDAVVLEETLDVEIVTPTLARLRYANRTRILTTRGAEDHAEDGVTYKPSMTVRSLRGAVTTPQGKRIEIKKQDIMDAAAFSSYALYDDTRARIIHFPGLAPGATLEYSYEIEYRNLFYLPYDARMDFQDRTPARARTFTMRAPAVYPLRISVRGSPEHRQEDKDGIVIHTWSARDVPGLKREWYMPPDEDVYPSVQVFPKELRWEDRPIDAETWAGIARWYWDLAADRMAPTPEVAARARELTAGVDDPMEKTRRLFEYAQKKIHYVAIELGIGGYQPHHNGDVLRYAYGDCKDKATLFIAMMRAVELTAWPVLILTRDDGLTDREFPATIFNHVIAAVPTGDGYLFLDPTDQETAFGDLPWVDQGANVLVVRDQGRGEMVQTPLHPPDRNRTHRLVSATIDPDGNLTGTYIMDVWGQPRKEYQEFVDSKPGDQEDDLEDLMAWLCPGARMQAHEVKPPAGPDDPLRILIRFDVPRFLTRAGGLDLATPYLVRFHDLTRITAYSGRRFPVFFDYLSSSTSEVHLRLPQGRALRKVPADRDLEGPGLKASTRHEVQQDGGRQVLVIRRSIAVERRQIPVADYPALREFLAAVAQEEARAVTLAPAG